MKRLLLLIVLCAWSVTVSAQMHEMSHALSDSNVTLSPWQNVVLQPLKSKELLPTKVFSVWKEMPSKLTKNAVMFHARVIVVRPPRIIIHQQCVMYGAQVIFLQGPHVYIEPAKIVYDPPLQ